MSTLIQHLHEKKKDFIKIGCFVVTLDSLRSICKRNGEEKKDPPEEIPVTGMSISRASIVVRVGESKPLTASVYPENATEQRFFLELSNPLVASWDGGLSIYGNKTRHTVLTVWSFNGKFRASCGITVIPREEETNNINQ